VYLKDIINTNKNIKFNKLVFNSKEVNKNDIFILYNSNNKKYIKEALDRKCKLVLTTIDYKDKKVLKINLNDLKNILDKYYNFPLNSLNLIGVTGTDGKTSVTSIISDMLKCPSIGTNGFKYLGKYYSLNNTTPSLDILYLCFNKVRDNNNIVMEVSSEAYLTNRIPNLKFDIGILTDITRDHLDKHKDLNNYIECKLNLFRNSKISILNRDSKYYKLFYDNSNKVYSYGFNKESNFRIIKYKLFIDKSIIWFKYLNRYYKVEYPLVGLFNVYNIASSILTISLIYDIKTSIKLCKNIKPVLGRMNIVYNKDYKIIIDYAHTEKSTLEILKFYQRFSKNIITIVGCAGGRYKEKRKIIGDIVLKYSKLVIFTMDDPRYENVNSIILDMINPKYNNYIVEINRKKAIEKGISLCKKKYILLILGKGSDNYMMINNSKEYYSDYDTVFEIINKI